MLLNYNKRCEQCSNDRIFGNDYMIKIWFNF